MSVLSRFLLVGLVFYFVGTPMMANADYQADLNRETVFDEPGGKTLGPDDYNKIGIKETKTFDAKK
ncbi:MAG: hypothetical protein HY579_07035 [Nitrospinae bacterium]|nr:hypothetical protein [Nitrospinota bacterium]